MERLPKELARDFVNSQTFRSTTDIMNSMKELFSDVIGQVTCLNSRKSGRKTTPAASEAGKKIGTFYQPFTHIRRRFGR